MGKLIYLTGPVRSGKSRRAVELARAWGDDVVFVATYQNRGDDREMTDRLCRHRAERPVTWRTLEAPADVAAELAGLALPPSGVVLDCLTLWLGARFERDDDAVLADWDALLGALKTGSAPAVIVGNEIGWSPVPDSAELRRFRDLAGWLAQRTAAAADEAWLMVSGCPLRLK